MPSFDFPEEDGGIAEGAQKPQQPASQPGAAGTEAPVADVAPGVDAPDDRSRETGSPETRSPETGGRETGSPDTGGPEADSPAAGIAEADGPEPRPERQKPTARGALLVGARIAAGLVGIAIAVATVAAAGVLPIPTVVSKVPVTSVAPVASDQRRVCAGPLLRLGNDAGQDATTARSVGSPAVEFAASAGEVDWASLASTDSSTGVTPSEVTLPPDASHPTTAPLLAASQSQSVQASDFDGFAAAECREASGDSWLVGGSTLTGRTTLLTMSNPGSVIATVTLTVYTEKGEITAAGTDGIVVPPGGQRILSLAAFAPDAMSPVVRVQSSGSQVVANLQQAVVRTLEPGGVDVVGTSTVPSESAVIPGVIISSAAQVTTRTSDEGYEDLSPVIRLFVPGSASAKARITISPESGTAEPTKVSVTLAGGLVTEVPLGAFADGTYTVTVSSDKPVVAGARASTIGATGAVDLAWFAATPVSTTSALVAVADGPSPELQLANPTDQDAEVTVAAPGADDVTVTVPAGRAVAVPASGSTDYTITGFASLSIAVSYHGDGALASFGVTPAGPASQPITVYP